MKRRQLAAAGLALALPRVAAAEPHKLLVLQSEGRADRATRAKIDSAITRLATAVGCSKPDAASCKDDVLGMLSVDEIVITRVTPKPGGLEIAVQRVSKGGASRDATMLLPTGAPPDKLDGLAPLFGDQPAPATAGPPPAPAGPPPSPTAAAPPPGPAATSAPAGGPPPSSPAISTTEP